MGETAGHGFLRVVTQPVRGRGLLVTLGIALLVLDPIGVGPLLAWLLTVLVSALIVAGRDEPVFPIPARLRQPGLMALWQRAVATCALAEAPILVVILFVVLFRWVPDDPLVGSLGRIVAPISALLSFLGVAFIPGALIVAVREEGRVPWMLFLVPRRVALATREAIAAVVVAIVGYFFMFLGFILIQNAVPGWAQGVAQTALAIWWHLAVAGLTALSLPGEDGRAVLEA